MPDGLKYYCHILPVMNTIYGDIFKFQSLYLIARFIYFAHILFRKENTRYQIFGFVLLISLSIQFIVTFLTGEIDLTNIPLWGGEWGDMIGVILFNFVLVLAVPAICHEKKPELSIQKGMNVRLHIESLLHLSTSTLLLLLSHLWNIYNSFYSLDWFCIFLLPQ